MNPERPGWSEKKPKLNVEDASRLLTPAVNESRRFFSEDFTSFEVPDKFFKTEERLREIGFTRAEPLVLPQRILLENDPLWEGKVKPEPWFWRKIQYGTLESESAILQKGVYLIDGRPKPNYQDGLQRYKDDDFMEDLIGGLRRKGTIQRCRYVPEDSRYGVFPEEIEQVVLPELARVIGKDALGSEGKVVNNLYKIFNVAGNMRHPEWDETNTSEWFGDKPKSKYRLLGGRSDYGGLADIVYSWSDNQSGRVGFRPLIAFSSKT